MKLSFNWLKKYVALPGSVSAEEVAEKLKFSTVEVEEVIRQGELLGNVVVGKVLKAEKHPQADKLKLCQVDIKSEKMQIVCGGSNVREGMLVALAKVGAKVRWHGEAELVELNPTSIRGVESFGMICGSNEIGLEEIFPPTEDREIIDLTGKVGDKYIGKPLAEALGLDDVVLEIDNKSLSNRPDLWGHYGMAREVSVLFAKPLKEYGTKEIREPKKADFHLKVEVEDKKLCPRYMAVAVSGVKIGPSPDWLKEQLSAAGIRPINNIVDITNYLLFDLGQPMHAFDAKQLIAGNDRITKIVVRKAEAGEVLALLDGGKIELTAEDLVIADNEKPLALAGIMGGEHSGITEATDTIIFESANFNASTIRKSSTRLSLRTDSSARFEKSLDPNWCEMALRKAIQMTLELCPEAKVASVVSDIRDFTLATGPVVVEKKLFEKKLGAKMPEREIEKILTRLGFGVRDKGDKWSVTIPTWRATKDISIAEDLIEEAARVWGYDKIDATMPAFKINPPGDNILLALKNSVRDILVKSFAFDETYNYSFVSSQQISSIGDKADYLELDNPLSKEKPFLRRSLLPNILENALKNIELFELVKIFEIGKVFWPEHAGARAGADELLPRQDTYVCALYAGKKEEAPFFQVRKCVERIAGEFHIALTVEKPKTASPWAHPARSGDIICGGGVVGAIYELNPAVSRKIGLECRVAVMEVNLDLLAEVIAKTQNIIYEKFSEFPAVVRDLAFVVNDGITHFQIEQALAGIDPLVKTAELFDVYTGEKMPEGRKSMAYRLTLVSAERTLNSAEADAIMEKAVGVLKKKFGAEVRR